MLEEITKDIWAAQHPIRYMGLSLSTRMTIIRTSARTLIVISPVAINAELKQQIDALGTVEHIVAPNCYHHLYASEAKAHYPKAILWAAPGLKEKKPELPIDSVLQNGDSSLWNELEGIFFDGLKTLGFNGFDAFNEWVFFHPKSRTLILTDAAFHYDSSFPFFKRLVAKVLGSYETLRPSWLEKVATKDKARVKASVEKVLGWDFDRVIMAHGIIIERHGKAAFRRGYEQFLGEQIDLT
ncbi:MAG: DUF4336 domain-containing protein [Cyanobacteria bacterium J06598_1]